MEVIDRDMTLDALIRFAGSAMDAGEYDTAIRYLEALVEKDATQVVAMSNLAVLLYEQGRVEEAFAWFARAQQAISGQYAALSESASVALRQVAGDRAGHQLEQSAMHVQQILQTGAALYQRMAAGKAASSSDRLRVGFVSIWFERGQAYVTKAFRDAVATRHDTFVLARTGGVYGDKMLETGGFWAVPNLETYPEYTIPGNVLKDWIQRHGLDVVVFNEEYDWNLVAAAAESGVTVITYLDYYKDEWKPFMGLYDAVLCSSRRSTEMVAEIVSAINVGWAVDLDLFKPYEEDRPFTFFHNAGWLGINYRKMTPAAILAFEAASRVNPDITLLVHAQASADRLPVEVRRILVRNSRIRYHVGTVPAPGLYRYAKVLLFPSKLEGLGLPLPEGLASGMPAIAGDAPPMNEFVEHGRNGYLVRIARTLTRHDDIAIPETIVSLDDLAQKMLLIASDAQQLSEMSREARLLAEKQFSPAAFADRVNSAIEQTVHARADRRCAS